MAALDFASNIFGFVRSRSSGRCRGRRLAAAGFALVAAIGIGGAAGADDAPVKSETLSLLALVDGLKAVAPFDRASFEAVTGIRLLHADLPASPPGTYYANDVRLKDVTISNVVFYETVAGGKPPVFDFVRFTIASGCVSREQIDAAYGTLRFYPDSHMGPGSEISYGRDEDWGHWTFLLSYPGQGCAQTVAFNGKDAPGPAPTP